MTPEELAALFKRRGDFDSTRKNLLKDFQASNVGKQFTTQVGDILQNNIEEDPSLLQREKSEFHQLMADRITKSPEYKKVQQFVDSLLQPAQYMSKIENILMTIVKEQAPPPPEHEASTEQEKEKGGEKDHSKSSRKNHVAAKEETTGPTITSSKHGSSSQSLPSSNAPLPSSKSTSSLKREESNYSSNRSTAEKRAKDRPVKRELDLSLPPRPQPKKKEQLPILTPAVTGSNSTVVPPIKKGPNPPQSMPMESVTPRESTNQDSATPKPDVEDRSPKDVEDRSPKDIDPKNPSPKDPSLKTTPAEPVSEPSGERSESNGTATSTTMTSNTVNSEAGATMKVVPKKRNRRHSLDSNSSLSSPPSSSEPETDGEGKSGEGGRAKKLAKKAALLKEEPTSLVAKANADMSSDKIMDGTAAVVNDKEREKETDEVLNNEDSSMDVDSSPVTASVAEEKTSVGASDTACKELNEDKQDTINTATTNKDDGKESTPDSSLKSPVAPITTTAGTPTATSTARSSPSSSSSTPSLQQNSPATPGTAGIITSSSNGTHRKRDSEATDHRSSHSQGHGFSHSKRVVHQLLPLPPRPTVVPLPPRPAPLALNRRASSHSRNSSSNATGGNSTNGGAGGTGSPLVGSSSSSNLPTLPTIATTALTTAATPTTPSSSTPTTTTATGTAVSKHEKSPAVTSPTSVPTASSSSSSSLSPTSTSSKLKPHAGRTLIPLPHKPIPLPPKPSAAGSGSSSSLKKKHK
ncbi:complex proteins associated with Set1p component shg1-domain-containing protein [Dissophora ornata]|nr:hypothetical protein BGZ58_003949 [Dissophora ornata]KAI8600161.1 complex proteins associated with Set1p component shg1-domain-containing protein [Dissophora ornata]